MKQSINFSEFCDQFRAVRPDNFSYDGLKALFEHLEQYEEETGEEIEFDVIALCCDFNEETLEDIAGYYGINLSESEDESEKCEAICEYLNDNTMMFLINNSCDSLTDTVIYQAF